MASFALTWWRSPEWAALLGKPPGRAISNYPSMSFDNVKATAEHINSIDPYMNCEVTKVPAP